MNPGLSVWKGNDAPDHWLQQLTTADLTYLAR